MLERPCRVSREQAYVGPYMQMALLDLCRWWQYLHILMMCCSRCAEKTTPHVETVSKAVQPLLAVFDC